MGLSNGEPQGARGVGLGLLIALLGAPLFAWSSRRRGAPGVLAAAAPPYFDAAGGG
jgi:hypothetical protein